MARVGQSSFILRAVLGCISVTLSAVPTVSFAAPEGAIVGPASKLMEALIPDAKDKGQGLHDKLAAEMSSLDPLPGGYRNKGGQEQGGSTESEEDLGPEPKGATGLHLPTMKGFRELADAQPVQDMFKGLVTKKVPVLFQTMMMVENGAGTGFSNSMQAVSNLLSNQVETTQLSFQLDDMLDPSGQLKYNHGGAIVNSLQNPQVTTWPHALWDASGDDPVGSKIGTIETIQPDKPAHDHGDNPGDKSKGKQEKDKLNFAEDILFPERPSDFDTGQAEVGENAFKYDNSEIPELKEEFIKAVGNIVQTQTKVGDGRLAVKNSEKIMKGEEREGRWGLERRSYEESKLVWKNMAKLLNKICNYKKQNPNLDRQPTEKVLPVFESNFQSEEWKGSSSPDMMMTYILLEQIFNLSRPPGDFENINCEEEYSTNVEFPNSEFAELERSQPDSCKSSGGGSGVKGCLRLRVMNYLAILIGRSRALYYYETLHNVTSRFVQDPVAARMHQALFDNVVGSDPISTNIDKNRDKYQKFVVYLARYMQGQQTSGTVFKSGPANALPNSAAGFSDSKS
jgi:hypothetical protein